MTTTPLDDAPGLPDAGPRTVIVGAGLGGIAAAIALRGRGLSRITILEAAGGIGGTWYHNTYPGAACDVPGHLYSYSYAQRRDWTRLCSGQPELLAYVRAVADAHGISPLVRTDARVVACRYDDAAASWTVALADGSTVPADVLVLATGQLDRPAIPSIPGRERFAGRQFHSARWDHGYDLRGRRVAVVGTGATAVQLVPPVARAAAHLEVFQRSGSWLLPRTNRVYSPVNRAAIALLPGLQRLRRAYTYRVAEMLTVAIRHPRTAGRAGAAVSGWFMRSQLPDPDLRRRAWPDYPFGCKRVLFSSSYLPALARPDVELVSDPITAVTEAGLQTADGVEHRADCIIWATGFHTTELDAGIEVLGTDGRTLADAWRGGAHAHLGITTAGFPSLFFMFGPNTNTSGGSVIVFHEAQARYIAEAVDRLRRGGWRRLEVRPEVEAASDAALQARFSGTAWSACDSWYREENGRIVANWPGYMGQYIRATERLDESDYTFSR